MAEEQATVDESQDQAVEDTEASEAPEAPAEEAVGVSEVELPNVAEAPDPTGGGQIDILLDTSMPIEIRLGDVELEVRELLQLGPGSIVTLAKQAGEPLDLYLKGHRFATGQLVLVGESLGVRITEILPATNRPDAE